MKTTTNYSKKSDSEIVEIYKNNSHWRTKQEIETYFYKKYTPLCKKYSNRYRDISTFEDNMQECYFIMLKALDGPSIEKMESFGVSFSNYLWGYFGNVIKKQDTNKNTEEYITNPIEEDRTMPIIVNSQEDEIIFNSDVKGFYKQLSDTEKELVNLLQTNMKKKDIAKKLGFATIHNLYFWTNKIQHKYLQHMNECGYELSI